MHSIKNSLVHRQTKINNSKKRILLLTSLLAIILIVGSLLVYRNRTSAALEIWTQTNWNGGATANIANNNSNQNGWNQYSAKDANITAVNSGADLQLTTQAGLSNVDFNTESQYTQQASVKTQFTGSSATLEGSALANSTLGANSKQTIGTVGAFDWQSFTIGTDTYAFVANANNDNVASYAISSYLYKWRSDLNCFGNVNGCANSVAGTNAFQAIGTYGATDWNVFTVGTDTYALVADLYDGSSYATNSYLYKWRSDLNCFGNATGCANSTQASHVLQSIRSNGASDWETFTSGTDTYILLANVSPDGANDTSSLLFKWMSGSK